jgi:hypothetical protein
MKLEITNIGCEELLVEYGTGKFGWWPKTGALRYWTKSKPTVICKNKRELVSWLVARKSKFAY